MNHLSATSFSQYFLSLTTHSKFSAIYYRVASMWHPTTHSKFSAIYYRVVSMWHPNYLSTEIICSPQILGQRVSKPNFVHDLTILGCLSNQGVRENFFNSVKSPVVLANVFNRNFPSKILFHFLGTTLLILFLVKHF